ncbi:MAG: DUF87 domain-containing protein, partial [Gammaproteobacteria bacterium]|nr:DUF87 domain-containing protein [Gammaproteobacteria bacterium]
MQLINIHLWMQILWSTVGGRPLPPAYHEAIIPIIHFFAGYSNYDWFFISCMLITVMLIMVKLGRGCLKGVKNLPLATSFQKGFCQMFEIVLLLAWIGVCLYVLSVLILGLIWFKDLGYVAWIAKKFLPGWILGLFLGLVMGVILKRMIARRIDPWLSKYIDNKATGADHSKLSDIRDVSKAIANSKEFDPKSYFKDDAVFFGKDEHNKAIYVDLKRFLGNHIQIMGYTGSGKGVAAACMMSQLIKTGVATVVFDPKRGGDEWAPHVLKSIAKSSGKRFILMNLQAEKPQINLLKDISANELEELLQGSMGLQDTGGDSDYYRRKDRKAAMLAATLAQKAEWIPHLRALCYQEFPDEMEAGEGFSEQLEVLARIPEVQTTAGVDIKKAIKDGDCIYIIGTESVPRIQLLQKMILLRIKQIIERRERLEQHRHVTIFLDELKCFLTRPVLLSLAMIRDHNCNFILAHQSPSDLYDVSRDLNPKSVYGGVMENTNIKLMYKQNDPDGQQRAALLTGEKVVMRESKEIATNVGMGQVVDTDKQYVTSTTEPLFSKNVFALLPPRVGVLNGLGGVATLCFTAPVKANKTLLAIGKYEFCPDYSNAAEDVSDIDTVNKTQVYKSNIISD